MLVYQRVTMDAMVFFGAIPGGPGPQDADEGAAGEPPEIGHAQHVPRCILGPLKQRWGWNMIEIDRIQK